MANCELRARRGLGPRIDPHFDAAVGRLVIDPTSSRWPTLAPGEGNVSNEQAKLATGYIELVGMRPYDSFIALLAAIFDPAGRSMPWVQRWTFWLGMHDRPHVWTQITALRYLTTDEVTGVALPLASFSPDTKHTGWPGNGPAQLQGAIQRLDQITENKLRSATMIGLTVSFNFGIIAEDLKPIFQPGMVRRRLGTSAPQERKRIEQVLFGGVTPFLQSLRQESDARSGKFDAQDLALSSGFNLQLKRAMRELRNGNVRVTHPNADLDYGMMETGAEVIVGVVDFGCDFAHPSFRKGTTSRILALWDQNAGPEGGAGEQPLVRPADAGAIIGDEACRFGYGRLFTQQDIELVLKTWQETSPSDGQAPYRMLGYDPHHHYYTSKAPGAGTGAPSGAHGTMVLGTAAGGRRKSCSYFGDAEMPTVVGVAPDAKIVFVQVRTHVQGDGRRILDANDVVDGVAFIIHTADQRRLPCVINLSLNTMSGPHDGDGHFERRLSSLLKSGRAGSQIRGRAVVVAAGNLPEQEFEMRRWQHITDKVLPAQPFAFFWLHVLSASTPDRTRNSLEIWYDAQEAWLQVSLTPPGEAPLGPIVPGEAAELLIDGKVRGSVIGSRIRPDMRDNRSVRDRDGNLRSAEPLPDEDCVRGRHVILLQLDPDLAIGSPWKVTLEAIDKSHTPLPADAAPPIAFHAWLERDDEGQSAINRQNPPQGIPTSDRVSTLGTLSCGEDAIVVGAYDTSASPIGGWNLSGRGPPRSGDAQKPDISAPGNQVLLIRSKEKDCAFESGTSVAAPFVTGTIACLYQVAPRAKLSTVKQALISTTRSGFGVPAQTWSEEFGHGRLNPQAAVDWMKREGSSDDE